jgi:fibronectin type 3 domain-containing protein
MLNKQRLQSVPQTLSIVPFIRSHRPGWMGRLLALAGLVALGSSHTALAASSVTLAWDPSASTNVIAYRIYYGVASGTYTNSITVTNATTVSLGGLNTGATYYCAATAIDRSGLESIPSNEIQYSPVAARPFPATLALQVTSAGKALLTGVAPAGYTYDVQTAQSLTNWTAIGSVTADANSSVRFTNAIGSSPRGFYRLRQTYP